MLDKSDVRPIYLRHHETRAGGAEEWQPGDAYPADSPAIVETVGWHVGTHGTGLQMVYVVATMVCDREPGAHAYQVRQTVEIPVVNVVRIGFLTPAAFEPKPGPAADLPPSDEPATAPAG